MTRLAMTMQILTKCARCGALVEPCQMPTTSHAETVRLWSTVATCTVDTSGTVAMDFTSTFVLCHDCIGQLTDWLTGESDALQNPQASTDGVAALVRDMAVALDFSRDSAWCSCRYFYHSEDCNGCPADGSGQPCHRVLFDDIRRRCETLGIDLKAGDR